MAVLTALAAAAAAGTPAKHPCWTETPAGVVNISRMQRVLVELPSWGWDLRWDIGFCQRGESKVHHAVQCPSAFPSAPNFHAAVYLSERYGSRGVDCVWPFGDIGSTMVWTRRSGDPTDLGTYSVSIELRGDPPEAATFPASTPRYLNLTLHCNTDLGNEIRSTAAQQRSGIEQKGSGVASDPLRYYAEFETGWACPGAELAPPSDHQGLTVGGIFLICFFCSAFVYVAAGVAYNYKVRELRGAQVIPNVDFWKDLPALVWDGMRFTGSSARRLVRGDQQQYESV
eukprot:TRINITY_DN44206_c0_g1_i1.p1 TRINITY_DN44206_c0_g1~~TRINITY_DN44206_c0_g1_i1.p1  ORF type:complete len:305 (+),score=96.76 TRINITY_DN44206_c0_g1_i1:61-915(+)